MPGMHERQSLHEPDYLLECLGLAVLGVRNTGLLSDDNAGECLGMRSLYCGQLLRFATQLHQ